MQMCWADHPDTTEQPTCCIRCSPIKEVSLAGLPLPKRFKKAAMLGGESFDFYISLYYATVSGPSQKEIKIQLEPDLRKSISRIKAGHC